MKTPLFYIVTALAAAAFGAGGCSTTGNSSVADKASNFAASPTGRVLEISLISAAASASQQYAAGEKIDGHKIVADTLDGAAEGLRSLASTSRAASPGSIAGAVTTGAGIRAFDNTVSPIVAGQVVRQIEDGTHPDQAIENVATTMNAAAAAARTRQPKTAGDGP
jgi:hypothetical protein